MFKTALFRKKLFQESKMNKPKINLDKTIFLRGKLDLDNKRTEYIFSKEIKISPYVFLTKTI